jgi:hypothetical protein
MLDAFTRSIPDNGGDKFTLAADRSVTTPKNPRRKPTLLRAPDNSVSGPDSRSTQLPMCASSGSTWRQARSSL